MEMADSEDILKKLVAGNIDEIEGMETRHVKMIVDGKRIPNIVLKKAVEKLRANKMPDKLIIEQILKFDDLAEKGHLIEYLNKQKKK